MGGTISHQSQVPPPDDNRQNRADAVPESTLDIFRSLSESRDELPFQIFDDYLEPHVVGTSDILTGYLPNESLAQLWSNTKNLNLGQHLRQVLQGQQDRPLLPKDFLFLMKESNKIKDVIRKIANDDIGIFIRACCSAALDDKSAIHAAEVIYLSFSCGKESPDDHQIISWMEEMFPLMTEYLLAWVKVRLGILDKKPNLPGLRLPDSNEVIKSCNPSLIATTWILSCCLGGPFIRSPDWFLLYDSVRDGLSISSFRACTLEYPAETIFLITDTDGNIFGAALVEPWRDSSMLFGQGCEIFMVAPYLYVLRKKGRMNSGLFNSKSRAAPLGIAFGCDPRRMSFHINEDLLTGVRRFSPKNPTRYFEEKFRIQSIQLWGLGNRASWESQQAMRNRDDRLAMQRRITSLPAAEEWEADSWVLEMGGVKVKHEKSRPGME